MVSKRPALRHVSFRKISFYSLFIGNKVYVKLLRIDFRPVLSLTAIKPFADATKVIQIQRRSALFANFSVTCAASSSIGIVSPIQAAETQQNNTATAARRLYRNSMRLAHQIIDIQHINRQKNHPLPTVEGLSAEREGS